MQNMTRQLLNIFRYCCPARQAVRCICMYYMLVRLSVCLNHIKGTIIIIIITHIMSFFGFIVEVYRLLINKTKFNIREI